MSEWKRQDQDKFVMRMPDGMRERIKARAAASGRSMNAEILMMIEIAMPRDDPEDQRLARIEAKLDELLAK